MRRLAYLPALAAAALLAAGPATAQPASDAGDLDCMVVAFFMAASQDPTAQTAGMMSSFYFLGKLRGANPGRNLEKEISDAIPRIEKSDVGALATRCGGELQKEGAQMQTIGANLQAKGR